jgi:type II secretory pathway pseudopilin PulG
MKKWQRTRGGGFTVIELIIYLAVMALLTSAVVYSIYGLVSTYQKIKVVKAVERSAIVALDTIGREIRGASDFLSTTTGSIRLDSTIGSGTRSVLFYRDLNGVVRVSENGIDTGPLTASNASTTRLVFFPITTLRSRAVMVEMTVRASSTRYVSEERFYTTAVLRGSY